MRRELKTILLTERSKFRSFLRTRYCDEMLIFWEKATKYLKSNQNDISTAETLFTEFIDENAVYALNVTYTLKERFIDALKAGDPDEVRDILERIKGVVERDLSENFVLEYKNWRDEDQPEDHVEVVIEEFNVSAGKRTVKRRRKSIEEVVVESPNFASIVKNTELLSSFRQFLKKRKKDSYISVFLNWVFCSASNNPPDEKLLKKIRKNPPLNIGEYLDERNAEDIELDIMIDELREVLEDLFLDYRIHILSKH
eukprot:TRINITY_DN2557_c0_g1_i2.p1 TRINITY_DN2557_c0_g1~~TRINITY_DN2557_c0_g1_i2.p1  ORF type:complete len:255 (+),score=61.29 TRINITY_DN2557_c0_g1_i2:52-816(+)